MGYASQRYTTRFLSQDETCNKPNVYIYFKCQMKDEYAIYPTQAIGTNVVSDYMQCSSFTL